MTENLVRPLHPQLLLLLLLLLLLMMMMMMLVMMSMQPCAGWHSSTAHAPLASLGFGAARASGAHALASGEVRRRRLHADATGAVARLQGSRPRHKHLPKEFDAGAISGSHA